MEFEISFFTIFFASIFFSFTIAFCVFSTFLFIAWLKRLCNCHVCKTFLAATWTSQFSNLCDWYTHLLAQSPTSTIQIHVLNNIITSNPENVEHMLKTKFYNYPKGKPFSTLLGDFLGKGIFNVDGDPWTFQRKMASLELGSVSVRSYAYEVMSVEIRSRLLPLLFSACGKQDGFLDLQDVFKRFSFDGICQFSFGLDPGCLNLSLPRSEFEVAFDLASKLSAERAMVASTLIWKLKRFFNFGSEKKLKEAIKTVHKLAEEVISNRRKLGFLSKKDLLSNFMATMDDDDYLRDIIISFVLAGRDTVASALTSFFWLLSTRPDVEAMIRAESDQIMGPTEDLASFDQVREMHYLQAAIYETMRLYPPVQFDSKFCLDDDYFPDGTFIQKGTRVTYHPYAMGRMDRIWGPDCLEFKPERWLKSGVFNPESLYKYPVFQAGLRVCLGKELAVVEMKCVAVSLIRRFNIRVAEPIHMLKFSPGLTATVKGGLPVRVEEIE